VDKAGMLGAYGVAGIPLVDSRATFLRPSHYGEEIEIISTVTAVGRSSFGIAHKLFNGGELAVEAHEKRVWTVRDTASGCLKSQPMPRDVALKLSGG
jgi:4-hydroxybenzoyl-CoA thioesterase